MATLNRKSENSRNANWRKIAALVLGLAIIFVLFFSAFYLAAETHHHCTGENCPVCATLQLCERSLRRLGSGIAVLAVSILPAIFFIVPRVSHFRDLSASTPVTKKVRLNN